MLTINKTIYKPTNIDQEQITLQEYIIYLNYLNFKPLLKYTNDRRLLVSNDAFRKGE